MVDKILLPEIHRPPGIRRVGRTRGCGQVAVDSCRCTRYVHADLSCVLVQRQVVRHWNVRIQMLSETTDVHPPLSARKQLSPLSPHLLHRLRSRSPLLPSPLPCPSFLSFLPSLSLEVGPIKSNTYGRRVFVLSCWPDGLELSPGFIRDPTSSTDCFKRLHKTYLFARY